MFVGTRWLHCQGHDKSMCVGLREKAGSVAQRAFSLFLKGVTASTHTSAMTTVLTKPKPPESVAPDRGKQHDSIAQVARAQNANHSSFRNGVSMHRMSQSVSFTNLRAILTAAQGQEHRTFVGTRNGEIVVSINFNYQRTAVPPPPPVSKKRRRDPQEEAVEQAVERVKRGLDATAEVTDDMLNSARMALYTMLTRLRGANGETAVESWGISYKRPEGSANGPAGIGMPGPQHRPRLILSARLAPGLAVPLPSLFQSLGVRCTADGMLTTQDSTSLASGFDLPLSEAARAAEAHGQRALTLFATVGKA